MRKLGLIIMAMALPLLGMSQSIFDKYEDSEKIGTVTINKGMLKLAATVMEHDEDEDTQQFVEMARSINNIKVFMSEDADASADMNATMKKYVKSSKLEELMKVRDGDTHVNFYIRNGKDDTHVAELLMFVTGIDEKHHSKNGRNFETVLLTMTGDIDLTKVGSLTRKMKLHKGLNKLEEH